MPWTRAALIASAMIAAISVGVAVNRTPPAPPPTVAEQNAMIATMVTGLAQRLESDPKNVEGWIMLMRSYAALGDGNAARTARARAKSANPGAAKAIDAAAIEIGLTP
jgi:cytochrome c-type biogenesis protein CcmH/NrfG